MPVMNTLSRRLQMRSSSSAVWAVSDVSQQLSITHDPQFTNSIHNKGLTQRGTTPVMNTLSRRLRMRSSF